LIITRNVVKCTDTKGYQYLTRGMQKQTVSCRLPFPYRCQSKCQITRRRKSGISCD